VTAAARCLSGVHNMDADPIIRIENLSYQYPRSPAFVLRDVNLNVQRGEFLGIVGPTGAGKTTLCLALNGIVPQFYGGRFFGHVTVAGLDTIENRIYELAQHVTLVFQDPETQLIANSVQDEVAFGLENFQVARSEMPQRIQWALEAVRLKGMLHRHPSELSGGEKQRLAIAAALAVQPDVLVLDEPTSQLDPLGKQEVFATIRELNERLGITVILASHASEELAEFADRVALLDQGQLVSLDTPERIFSGRDLLARHAVRPPQVTEFYIELARQGLEPPSIPVTLQEATAAYEQMRDKIAVCACPAAEALPPPSEPPLLSAHDVHYTYGDGTRALRHVTLDIHQGEYVVIVGQNGAGKTTLAKHFLHLLEPQAGEVHLAGRDVRTLAVSDIAQTIGFVAQNPDQQIFSTTVASEVSFALQSLGTRGPELEARVAESLQTMGLTDLRDRHPLSLAQGDRARVVIAAALAMRPDVLIFDEPTTGQDYNGAKRILDVSRRFHQAGKTVIVITHHLYLMPGYAQRVVVMGRGVVLGDLPLRQAFHSSELLRSTYLAAPQIVRLAQYISAREQVPLPILTPKELAACLRLRRTSP